MIIFIKGPIYTHSKITIKLNRCEILRGGWGGGGKGFQKRGEYKKRKKVVLKKKRFFY